MLLSARGPAPSFAERVAGGRIRGSWWAHPRGRDIYRLAEAVEDSGEVLMCRLIEGKVTWVHRRLWPALVRLADRLPREGLARVWSEHTASGAHRRREIPFPDWVPEEVRASAKDLTATAAEEQLAAVLAVAPKRRRHP